MSSKYNYELLNDHLSASEGSCGSSDFLRRGNGGRSLEYGIVKFCKYVQMYYAVKARYESFFKSNKRNISDSCGITSIKSRFDRIVYSVMLKKYTKGVIDETIVFDCM
jgi:hypothetical protein